jgi:hypothetical protein
LNSLLTNMKETMERLTSNDYFLSILLETTTLLNLTFELCKKPFLLVSLVCLFIPSWFIIRALTTAMATPTSILVNMPSLLLSFKIIFRLLLSAFVLQDLALRVWVGALELPRFLLSGHGACNSLLCGRTEPGSSYSLSLPA